MIPLLSLMRITRCMELDTSFGFASALTSFAVLLMLCEIGQFLTNLCLILKRIQNLTHIFHHLRFIIVLCPTSSLFRNGL